MNCILLVNIGGRIRQLTIAVSIDRVHNSMQPSYCTAFAQGISKVCCLVKLVAESRKNFKEPVQTAKERQ